MDMDMDAKMNLEPDKVECRECGWRGLRVELDSVDDPKPKPGTVADIWCVCPECRQPENIKYLCDEPGCEIEATCGVPQAGVYRNTCGHHMPPLRARTI